MKKVIAIILSALMLMACLTACGGKVDKKVSTDGSTSMSKVINALGEAFMENNSGVNFTYNATGSGKSVLLKLLLMQAIRKGAIVCIADFKGGVDFPNVWHKNCRMCFEETNLLALLTELVDKLERRKSLFRESGCPNISQYNKATGAALKRYIFGCDEVGGTGQNRTE